MARTVAAAAKFVASVDRRPRSHGDSLHLCGLGISGKRKARPKSMVLTTKALAELRKSDGKWRSSASICVCRRRLKIDGVKIRATPSNEKRRRQTPLDGNNQ